jgi:hypothetical protein
MTENTPQHNPGDIANGHVLTHDAGWQPLSPPADEKKATKKAVWGRWYMIVAYVISGTDRARRGDRRRRRLRGGPDQARSRRSLGQRKGSRSRSR